jgi:hypothetical protein
MTTEVPEQEEKSEDRITRMDPCDPKHFGGGCLQGVFVGVTYAELCETFGQPNSIGDNYKIDVEWLFTASAVIDGKYHRDVNVSIYNWKNGPNYNREEGFKVEYIEEWHVGGRNSANKDIVLLALGRRE